MFGFMFMNSATMDSLEYIGFKHKKNALVLNRQEGKKKYSIVIQPKNKGVYSVSFQILDYGCRECKMPHTGNSILVEEMGLVKFCYKILKA